MSSSSSFIIPHFSSSSAEHWPPPPGPYSHHHHHHHHHRAEAEAEAEKAENHKTMTIIIFFFFFFFPLSTATATTNHVPLKRGKRSICFHTATPPVICTYTYTLLRLRCVRTSCVTITIIFLSILLIQIVVVVVVIGRSVIPMFIAAALNNPVLPRTASCSNHAVSSQSYMQSCMWRN